MHRRVPRIVLQFFPPILTEPTRYHEYIQSQREIQEENGTRPLPEETAASSCLSQSWSPNYFFADRRTAGECRRFSCQSKKLPTAVHRDRLCFYKSMVHVRPHWLFLPRQALPERGYVFVGVCVCVRVCVCLSVRLSTSVEIGHQRVIGWGVLNETLHANTWVSSLQCDMFLETAYSGVSQVRSLVCASSPRVMMKHAAQGRLSSFLAVGRDDHLRNHTRHSLTQVVSTRGDKALLGQRHAGETGESAGVMRRDGHDG